jgi:hypothetical protein
MSSSVVRQLVATVGFAGVAVLVGMPVRAQQVVLTPAGMQMVPIAPPVRAQESVTAVTTMDMKDVVSPAPKDDRTMDEIMQNRSDYVQSNDKLYAPEPGSQDVISVYIEDAENVKIGSSGYSLADLKNNYVPAQSMTREEMDRLGLVPTLSQSSSASATPKLINDQASPYLDQTADRSGNNSYLATPNLGNYQAPRYAGQATVNSTNNSSLTNSRVFPWSGY